MPEPLSVTPRFLPFHCAGEGPGEAAEDAAADGFAGQRHQRLTEAGIDTAYREGNLRLSVHLFNDPPDIDRALAALHTPGTLGSAGQVADAPRGRGARRR